MQYQIGDVAITRGSFTVVNTNQNFDPATVKVFIRNPAGVETAHVYGAVGSTVVKEAVGRYRFDLALTSAGGAGCGCSGWYFRWVGYDAFDVPLTAEEKFIEVEKSKFRTPY